MISTGYKYNVKFPKTRQFNGKYMTSFSLGEKIKDSPTGEYQNYSFTVWGESLPLTESDQVMIDEITSIQCAYYNGKRYYNISGKVTVEKQQVKEFADDDAPPFDIPDEHKTSAKPNIKEDDDKILVLDEDDTDLPFDL